MRLARMLALRVRSLLRGSAADRELAAELRYHLDRLTDEHVAAGMTPGEARAAAVREMGGIDQAAEACRDTRRVTILTDLGRDLRYAARSLRGNPIFSVVAILTLALGVGATTAIFTVVDGVVLRPLPYPDADRLVSIGTRSTRTGREFPRLTGGDILDIRAVSGAFDAFSAYWGGEIGAQVAGSGEFVGTYWVEPAFFRVFGAVPDRGRTFNDADGERCAVVSAGFAQRLFGSPDRALGGHVSVESQSYEIVGVMRRGFDAPKRTDVWLPIPTPLPRIARNRTAFNFQAVARLARGTDGERAQALLDALAGRLAAAYPDSNRERRFSVVPLRDRLVGQARPTLFALLGAVAIVLLIACVNVASLLLARATTRTHEISMRAALGASRWRIVRQLLTESVLLAVGGGVLGVALACGGTTLLLRMAPDTLPRLDEITVDWRVLAFATACSLVASLAFGLAPAWTAARRDVNAGLQQSGGRGSVGGRPSALRGALVVAEIALAVALAVGATLLIRSFVGLTRADLGFQADSVLVMNAHRPASGTAEYVRVAEFFSTLGARLSAVPGVTRAAAAMGLPTGRYGSNGTYEIEGRASQSAAEDRPAAGFRLASPGYFATLSVPLLAGRDFDEHDRHDAAFVAIVSRSLARQQFANADPIGRRIRCGLDSPETWMTIVGVVGDVRQDSPGSDPEPQIYMPLSQHPFYANEVQVVVRTAVPAASLAPALRALMQSLAPGTAVRFTTLGAMVSESIHTPRFRALLFGVFALLAVLLAMAGVYGVMAFLSVQRTAEFGLRVALGATRRRVFGHVVGRAVALGVPGLVLGWLLALGIGRVLEGMLFGLQATDFSTFAGVTLLLAGVVVLAAAVPAWRASRVDPVTVLRRG